NLYILKGAPQAEKDAACRVIQYLTQPEVVAQWSIDTGYVASRKSAYDTQLMKDFTAKKPQYLVTRDQLQYAQAEISTHQGGQVQKILGDAVQAALTGKQSAKDALTEAQDKADKLLSQFK
ncbi:MAG TPA: extracellular solute-binding protein, partial [Thermoflexales bacterium]|nr:extracellular solute-binding protein [Thermoflexales bacterium]